MIELTIDNSLCSVKNLTIEQHKEIKEILSYKVETPNGYYGYSAQTRHLIDRYGTFPTGLLYLVQLYFTQSKLKYSTIDKRRVPAPQGDLFTMSLVHTPYKEQIDAAKACKAFKRGVVVAPTGVGKSIIAALIINEMKVPTIVVVPSLELKRQLTESLKGIFGEGTVGKNKPIYVENVDSLSRQKLTQKYDCVIIDEFHHSGAKTYRKLNKSSWNDVYYKFGLTATPFRSNDNERLLLESVLSQVIYRVEYQEAVDNGYIVPLEAYYIELPKQKVKGTKWAQVYSELVVNHEARNKTIAEMLISLKTAGIPTLCLVKEIKHGEAISTLSRVHFANGQDEDTPDLIRFFNTGKLPALIGTTGIIGEGVDTKPAEYIIIAGLGKSKNAFMQQVGRGFRRYKDKASAKVIIIYDPSHKFTKNHFKTQCKILLEEYGIIPAKIV